ncbi:MAG: hypothetical protein VKJ64_15645, partial [Leptolyngbyaceae bacterium]|nr:hypothetical protein [Leptolyngbyaceae bacterium]
KKGAGGPFKGGRGGAKRRFDGGRPTRSGDRPSTLAHRSPGSKPVLKKNSPSNTGRSSSTDE